MAEESYGNVPLFRNLTAEEFDDREATEIESLCVNCEENGTTRLLLTKIPFFKEIIIMSFECPHCGFANNEIQPGGRVQDKGCKYSVEIRNVEDLNRQLVKTSSSTIRIPSLDFEIPPKKGEFTTIEGVISKTVEDLEHDQPVRKALHPEIAEKIDSFIQKLKNPEFPFVIEVDDPAGNSFVENPVAPKPDPAMTVSFYERSAAQEKLLGFLPDDYDESEPAQDSATQTEENREKAPSPTTDDVNHKGAEGATAEEPFKVTEEVMSFPGNCSECNSPAQTRMKLCNIPFFKEVVIMAVTCDVCGYKSSDVKSGGGIEEKGKRMKLNITDPSDLSRDVLQSETCTVKIPELEFECPMGLNSGKFTTLEGLLTDIKTDLGGKNPFVMGDSAVTERKNAVADFIVSLDKVLSGESKVTIVLDDPAGNSYLQNVYAPDPDPEMTIEEYERTEEQNDDLGLTHMKTENYYEEDD